MPQTCHGMPPNTRSSAESIQTPEYAGSKVPSHETSNPLFFPVWLLLLMASLATGVMAVLLLLSDDVNGWTELKMSRPAIALWVAANGTATHCRHARREHSTTRCHEAYQSQFWWIWIGYGYF